LLEEEIRLEHRNCRSCFRVGIPFRQIVQEAEKIAASLIVISSHSYRWLERLLHGSTAGISTASYASSRSCRQRTRHRSGPGSARDAVASVVGKSRRNIEHKFARGISHFSCGVDIRMVRPQVLMRVVTEGADSVSFSQYDQNILATIRRVIHPSS